MKGISEICGFTNLAEELGFDFGIRHLLDASATKGILMRTGAGKIKHLTVRQLWVQEAVEEI